ncbi:MAG: YbaB/EbfC family nucleoid-associated protein [Desulfobacteraceae bacterium]|nr:YbaB/EbfC family nucleoid-associated protein [Desulfobacteraceae bacterium]
MDIGKVMREAQLFQRRLSEIQGELAGQRLTSTVGGGMVTVTVNGKSELLAIVIDPELVNPAELTMLQDLIVAGVNEALRQAAETAREKMTALTGGLNLPGLAGLFG